MMKMDKVVARCFYRYCAGLQVNVLDIGKVFAFGRLQLAKGVSGEALGKAMREYVGRLAEKAE